MIFGHLKAADFMNVLEGGELTERRRTHLGSCKRCSETLASVQGVQTKVMEMSMAVDDHIPEPDWSDFRADVRTKLLSRSVKRETTSQRWMGLTWKPAVVWSMSVMFILGLTAGMVVWNRPPEIPPSQTVSEPGAGLPITSESLAALESPAELIAGTEMDVFEAVVRLNPEEAESLQKLLESTPGGVQ